jgi:hypothetical protein
MIDQNKVASVAEIKKIDGVQFEFCSQGIPELNIDPYWESMKGNIVFVFPPTQKRNRWAYWSPTSRSSQAICVLAGEDQEARAFSIAALFCKQKAN